MASQLLSEVLNTYVTEKTASLTNAVGKIGYTHVED
jgi:hypothetical protein